LRYIYSEQDNPMANDYYYEASIETHDHFPIIPARTHNYYEIYIYDTGSVRLSVDDIIYDVKKGDIVVIPPYTIHQLLPAAQYDNNQPYKRLLIYISDGCLKSFQFNEHGLLNTLRRAVKDKRFLFRISNPDTYADMRRCIENLYAEQNSVAYGAELLRRSYILNFMSLLCRNIREEFTPQGVLHINPLVEKIISYINSNYTDDISMDYLSEQFYVNRSTLTKEFKNHTAQTIHSYLIMKRINAAKQEMANGTPPSQAFLLTGFKEYSTFYRTFLKNEGISPKTFYQNCHSSDKN